MEFIQIFVGVNILNETNHCLLLPEEFKRFLDVSKHLFDYKQLDLGLERLTLNETCEVCMLLTEVNVQHKMQNKKRAV